MPLEVRWPFPPPGKIPWTWRVSSKFAFAAVGGFSKLWSEWFNDVKVYNKQTLLDLVERRQKKQSLLTISNHHSCMDDPMLWGVLRMGLLCRRTDVFRWTLAAADICFTKTSHAYFFSLGQTVPVCRGEGVYQKAMDFMVQKLNSGNWVHMFPEGKVNMTKEYMRLKWGVGRLIADCSHLPVVLPICHIGMDSVLPNRPPYIPQIGKKVTMLIGQPMDFADTLQSLREAQKSPREIRKVVTDLIQEEFQVLKDKAEKLHLECTLQS